MSPSPTELVRPRWSHLEYSWQLDNFWELRALACVEALDDENGSLIWSQPFGDNALGRWQMKLYPYGDLSPAGRGHVSLFLSMDLKSLSKAYAVFGCYLLDEEGTKISNSGRSFTRQKFSEGSSSWGWSQFIKNEGQSLSKFLTCNDSLIIKCEIEVFTGILTSPPSAFVPAASLEADLRAFFCDPRHYNVTILTKDGRELRACKEILQARSEWFLRELARNNSVHTLQSKELKMSSSGVDLDDTITTVTSAAITPSVNTARDLGYTSFGLDEPLPAAPAPRVQKIDLRPSQSQTQDVVVVLDTISADIVQNVIEFTHTDECQFHDPSTRIQDVLDLLTAARELEIPSLYRATCRKLCAYLTTKSQAIAIQHVARRLDDRALEDHCTTYLTMCVRDLSKDEIVKTLTSRKPASTS